MTDFLTASQALTTSTWLVVTIIGVGSVIAAFLFAESWRDRRRYESSLSDATRIANESAARRRGEV